MYREEGMRDLVETLSRFSIPHDIVSLDPATGALSPDVRPEGAVMICGTYRLSRLAAERGWFPGSFLNANHDHRAWTAAWGGRMLNAAARTTRFADARPAPGRVFIRPAADNKYFDGQVLDAEEVDAWRDALCRGGRSPVRCSDKVGPETEVTWGPAHPIYRESRFFVVDGEIAASTTYRIGRDTVASPDVDPQALAYARGAVAEWRPARAFALDVALTDGGYRIVEVNCINMSGFYGADVQRLVMALDGMEFPGPEDASGRDPVTEGTPRRP